MTVSPQPAAHDMGNGDGPTSSDDFPITAGGPELLDRVAPLWHALRSHHAQMAPAWRDGLLTATFDDRKAGLLAKVAGGGGGLLVLLATAGRPDHGVADVPAIGYCVCTVTPCGRGEI